jgi:hypothetical protein
MQMYGFRGVGQVCWDGNLHNVPCGKESGPFDSFLLKVLLCGTLICFVFWIQRLLKPKPSIPRKKADL